MLLKELFIWAFWGQNMGSDWIKNGRKGCFQTSQLTSNPVFIKSKVLNSQSPNILSKRKDELTDLHNMKYYKSLFFTESNFTETCLL